MTRSGGIWVAVFTLVFCVGSAFAQDEDFFVVVAGGRDWRLSGNAATTPGTHFLGTTDNQALELKVNNRRCLRLEPDPESPNIVGGHEDNTVTADVYGATISGGGRSGYGNVISATLGTVGGGSANVAGGSGATVGGGGFNTASASLATVGGGLGNKATGEQSAVGGGYGNEASGKSATVSGGEGNEASANWATVGGGFENAAGGKEATVPGGAFNVAAGDQSFAAGRRAKANSMGCFVWGDSTWEDVSCNNENRWIARASGGVYFYTSGNLSTGVYVASGSETWNQVSASNRELKKDFEAVDVRAVLAEVAQLPLSKWSFKASETGARHIGPMAQDFYAAFGVGEDDRHIGAMDANGVALAAIQGLYEILKEKDKRIEALESRLSQLETLLLRQRCALIEGLGTFDLPRNPIPSTTYNLDLRFAHLLAER